MRAFVLLYHDIKEDEFDLSSVKKGLHPYILRQSDFEKQMAWLYKNGYRVLSIRDFLSSPIPDRYPLNAIILTFDDGWRSNYEIAYPLLKKYGFTATFFVTVENIGKKNMLSWGEIKELAESGIEIGSHNMTHRVPIELSSKELEEELRSSKKTLEDKLNISVISFSLPTGFFDKRVADLAREAGYKTVSFTKFKISRIDVGSEPVCLNKIGIKRSHSLDDFRRIVEGSPSYFFRQRMTQVIRDMVKKIAGPKNYISLKSFFLERAV